MKLLIVHDRAEVGDTIEDLISEMNNGPHLTVRVTNAFDARQQLETEIFDLLIIDLTIPARDQSIVSYEPAAELLKELFDCASMHVPGDIIGVTRDKSALNRIATDVGQHLMVAIEEDSQGVWKKSLLEKLRYAHRAAKTRYVSINQHYDYDALIITAMDKELTPYEGFFEFTEILHFPGAKTFLFRDKDGSERRGVALAIGNAGPPSSASYSQSLITMFRPKLAVMSGYCGGVKGKVQLGDLVFFESAYDWDYGRWEEEKRSQFLGFGSKRPVFRSRPTPINIRDSKAYNIARELQSSDFNRGPDLLTAIKKESLGRIEQFSVHLRPAASGAAVVANDQIIHQIRGLNESICAVDMESYGFYHAAQYTRVIKPGFICVKSVSDYCNGEKEDGLHNSCSLISATAAHQILTEKWEFSELAALG